MVLRISYENRWTRTPCRGYASLRKATDRYGSRDSSQHVAGGQEEMVRQRGIWEEAGRACAAHWEGRILEKDKETLNPKP